MNPLKSRFNIVDFCLMPAMGRWLVEAEWGLLAIAFPIWLVLSIFLEGYGKAKWGWE
jgi:hypothetical protein